MLINSEHRDTLHTEPTLPDLPSGLSRRVQSKEIEKSYSETREQYARLSASNPEAAENYLQSVAKTEAFSAQRSDYLRLRMQMTEKVNRAENLVRQYKGRAKNTPYEPTLDQVLHDIGFVADMLRQGSTLVKELEMSSFHRAEVSADPPAPKYELDEAPVRKRTEKAQSAQNEQRVAELVGSPVSRADVGKHAELDGRPVSRADAGKHAELVGSPGFEPESPVDRQWSRRSSSVDSAASRDDLEHVMSVHFMKIDIEGQIDAMLAGGALGEYGRQHLQESLKGGDNTNLDGERPRRHPNSQREAEVIEEAMPKKLTLARR